MRQTVHDQVIELLDRLKAVALLGDHKRSDELSIEITTLTAAYMLPEIETDWLDLGLSSQEQRLMHALQARKGRCLSREVLMNALFFDRPDCDWPEDKIVDVVVCKIRKKLRAGRARTAHADIENVWGTGYRYVELVA